MQCSSGAGGDEDEQRQGQHSDAQSRCKKLCSLHFQLAVPILYPYPFLTSFSCFWFHFPFPMFGFGDTTLDPPVPNLLILQQTLCPLLLPKTLQPQGVFPFPCFPFHNSGALWHHFQHFMEQLAQGGTYVTCLKLIFGKHSHTHKYVTHVLLPDRKSSFATGGCVQVSKHRQDFTSKK